MITNRIHTHIPAHVLEELAKLQLHYSTIAHVFHCIQISTTHWVGVAGDGDNGCYEWFSMFGTKMEHSNVGYGETTIALRDVLTKFAV
jgi:hypothetical protein